MTAEQLLAVRDLTVGFGAPGAETRVVRNVDLTVARNEAVGLVGESGSGKTVASLAIMGLVELSGGRVLSGRVEVEGDDVLAMSEAQRRELRGTRLAMVFQQPVRSLNPAFTVGDQIAETIRLHTGCSRAVAAKRAVELLADVEISRPAERARQYPHQLSGGMCQRVMIAMAISANPTLLIADEPTTALDVTVQKKVLELLMRIQERSGIGLLIISHDLSVIAEVCDRVTVMYSGEVVEEGSVEEVFLRPRHPYTSGLLGAIPGHDRSRRLIPIEGVVPPPSRLPQGCRFHPRCVHFESGRCDQEVPALTDGVRCVRADELALSGVRV